MAWCAMRLPSIALGSSPSTAGSSAGCAIWSGSCSPPTYAPRCKSRRAVHGYLDLLVAVQARQGEPWTPLTLRRGRSDLAGAVRNRAGTRGSPGLSDGELATVRRRALRSGAVASRAPEDRGRSVPDGELELVGWPLAAVAEFLRIDQDLLAAATEAATHEEEAGDPGRFKEWVKHLPAGERERWLLRAADHPSLALGSELLSAFHRVYPPVVAGQRRTVAELLARAEELEAERRRATADRAAQARAAA